MLNSKWHIYCATQLPSVMQQECLLSRDSMPILTYIQVVLLWMLMLKNKEKKKKKGMLLTFK